VPACSFR